ncbi:MAG: hypothetical protein LQ352_005070 [Teloschistes flavicans]|nr:MAG: hypothetical protein LQ352_005070 [Teloschistes flavicans]
MSTTSLEARHGSASSKSVSSSSWLTQTFHAQWFLELLALFGRVRDQVEEQKVERCGTRRIDMDHRTASEMSQGPEDGARIVGEQEASQNAGTSIPPHLIAGAGQDKMSRHPWNVELVSAEGQKSAVEQTLETEGWTRMHITTP